LNRFHNPLLLENNLKQLGKTNNRVTLMDNLKRTDFYFKTPFETSRTSNKPKQTAPVLKAQQPKATHLYRVWRLHKGDKPVKPREPKSSSPLKERARHLINWLNFFYSLNPQK
jgi:hypothetical protein